MRSDRSKGEATRDGSVGGSEPVVFYDINASEIPGELSRVNMISSHVKITSWCKS